jgi:hypothetical protein
MFLVANPEVFDECPELGIGFHFGIAEEPLSGVVEGFIVLNGTVALTPHDIMQSKSAELLSQLLSTAQDKVILQALSLTRSIVPSDDISLLKHHSGNSFQTCSDLRAAPASTPLLRFRRLLRAQRT